MKSILQSKINLNPLTAAIALMVLFSPLSGSWLAAQETAQPEKTQTETETDSTELVDGLLAKLDSSSFKDREAATEELIQCGPEIIEPLSLHFFNSSSEAGWRIHRVLEGIGRDCEEKDFLKSIAIIQLLYGAQDPQSQARLAKMQFQWKASRRTEAARKLRKLGFEFAAKSVNPGQDAFAERLLVDRMIRAVEIREMGGIEIATAAPDEGDKTEAPTKNEWVNPRLDRQESILKVEKIISGSPADNRAIVEGLLTPSFKADLPPGNLKIPKGWKPDEESLRLINDLSALSNLTLSDQTIDENLQTFISEQKLLTGLELINCTFDEESDELTFPATIRNLRFEGSLPPPASLRSLNQVSNLKLSKIKLDEDVAYAISKRKIQIIELEEVEFTRESITRVVNMRGLFRVSMSLCKFELEWLDDIRKRNPSIIFPAPTAFLGVQGPIDISGRELTGCQISKVVPETAAANSGMQPLDIVTAMDGTKISRFEDLRLMISQKRPGESMELEVRRGEETIKLKVELGELTDSIP